MDILYSLEAEFVSPAVHHLKAGYCLSTSHVSPLERERDAQQQQDLHPPDVKVGRVPLRRACGQPAVKTAWKENCSDALVMRPGRHLAFNFRSLCPRWMSWAASRYRSLRHLLCPNQLPVISLTLVSRPGPACVA